MMEATSHSSAAGVFDTELCFMSNAGGNQMVW